MSLTKVKQAIKKGKLDEARALLQPYLDDPEARTEEVFRLAAQLAQDEQKRREFVAQAEYLKSKARKSGCRRSINVFAAFVVVGLILLIFFGTTTKPSTVRRTATPAPGTLTNPLPFGVPSPVQDGRFQVNRLRRGMTEEVQEMNMFNQEPEFNQEWVLVNVTLFCDLPADETCVADHMDLELTGSMGEIYNAEILAVLDDKFGGEVFGGGQITGNVGFIIARDDNNLLLIVKDRGNRTFFATE